MGIPSRSLRRKGSQIRRLRRHRAQEPSKILPKFAGYVNATHAGSKAPTSDVASCNRPHPESALSSLPSTSCHASERAIALSGTHALPCRTSSNAAQTNSTSPLTGHVTSSREELLKSPGARDRYAHHILVLGAPGQIPCETPRAIQPVISSEDDKADIVELLPEDRRHVPDEELHGE